MNEPPANEPSGNMPTGNEPHEVGPLYRMHGSVHARGEGVGSGESIELAGRSVATLAVGPEQMATPLPVRFEEALEALGRLPRLFIEPDGSFVWTSSASEPTLWQLDGVLWDRGGQLNHVDLKGTCPPARFDELLSALGWPGAEMMFQLAIEAVFLDDAEFRRWACA
ncbi:MAG: hypothetical protein DWQ31_04845 [Planctomycetota bacterium]|nr:MAG: hypothetical protein DWQ31_04845 [Planctomycetota bacterium]REJ87865.1 MAG: hypothetical protein DWQ35_20730 [Planctomycetota bacterium]REK26441.1 MAG: hypothetical protein DWQ42_08940 [Planctomycetota bacterium]REK38721.1 MAG: hypothetical protein DWQ46_20035 [Planctomycetota bacterium]